jgi:hypothetical protein
MSRQKARETLAVMWHMDGEAGYAPSQRQDLAEPNIPLVSVRSGHTDLVRSKPPTTLLRQTIWR